MCEFSFFLFFLYLPLGLYSAVTVYRLLLPRRRWRQKKVRVSLLCIYTRVCVCVCGCSLTMSDDLKLEDCVYKNVRSATSLSVHEREHMSSVCGASSSSTHTKFQGLSLSSREHKKTAKVYMQIDRYRDWTGWTGRLLLVQYGPIPGTNEKRTRKRNCFLFFFFFFFTGWGWFRSVWYSVYSKKEKKERKK